MKRYYVRGGIVIDTPFLRYENGGAGYEESMIPDAEVLPTNRKLPSGEPYLLINDNNLQSIFAEYYAGSFFSTGYCWAPLFHKTYEDDYSEFNKKSSEALKLMKISEEREDEDEKSILSRYAFLAIMTAFETYIADTILTRIVNDETLFYAYANSLQSEDSIKNYLKTDQKGKAEQAVIDYVLRKSYCDAKRIEDSYAQLFDIKVKVPKDINNLFKERHLLAHRGGRKKDGLFVHYSFDEIDTDLRIVNEFVLDLFNKIQGKSHKL